MNLYSKTKTNKYFFDSSNFTTINFKKYINLQNENKKHRENFQASII